MSLINQMLQDLDARQSVSGGSHQLPNDVRPLPMRRSVRWPLWLGGLAVLVLAGGLSLYQLEQLQQTTAPPALTSAPVSTPIPAPVPVPVPVPAPAPAPAPAPVLPEAPVSATAIAPLAVVAAPPPEPTAEAEKRAEPRSEVASPSSETTRRDTALRLRTAPSMVSPPVAAPKKPVKAAEVDGGKSPRSASRTPEAAEKPSPRSADREPPASGKPAKLPSIERSELEGSPRERAETEYRKAISAVNQGRIDDGVDGLRHALRDDSRHVASRQLLVRLLLEARRSEEAVAVLHEGLQGQPAQLGWAMTLARLQVDRDDLAGAWRTLEHSLPAAAHNADYQGFAAHLLQRLGRGREAAEHYQAAARLAPGEGRWWLGLGLALESEGQVREAREAFLRARQSGNLSSALTALVEQKLR